MLKKRITVILAIIMGIALVFAFTACNKSKAAGDSAETSEIAELTAQLEEAQTALETARSANATDAQIQKLEKEVSSIAKKLERRGVKTDLGKDVKADGKTAKAETEASAALDGIPISGRGDITAAKMNAAIDNLQKAYDILDSKEKARLKNMFTEIYISDGGSYVYCSGTDIAVGHECSWKDITRFFSEQANPAAYPTWIFYRALPQVADALLSEDSAGYTKTIENGYFSSGQDSMNLLQSNTWLSLDFKIGAFAYMRHTLHRFFAKSDKFKGLVNKDTERKMADKYDALLKSIISQGRVERKEVAAFYQKGINGLVAQVVDFGIGFSSTGPADYDGPVTKSEAQDLTNDITNFLLNPSDQLLDILISSDGKYFSGKTNITPAELMRILGYFDLVRM